MLQSIIEFQSFFTLAPTLVTELWLYYKVGSSRFPDIFFLSPHDLRILAITFDREFIFLHLPSAIIFLVRDAWGCLLLS